MKKTLVIALTILMSALLMISGCTQTPPGAQAPETTAPPASENAPDASQTEAPAKGKMKFAYTCQDLTNEFFIAVSSGITDRCNELGIEPIIHDGKGDLTGQVSAFENFTSQNVTAILVSPIDEKGLIPVVKSAKDSGIPTIGVCQDVEGTSARMLTNEYEFGLMIGEDAGKWIVEKLGGTAKVAIFDYPELVSIIDRGNGIADGILKVAPNAEIVARQSANNPEKGMAAMENILQAHPDVEVLATVNDAGALGAYEAIRAAGKESDRWYIGGLDAVGEALKLINEGTIYRATVDVDPYGIGRLAVDLAVKVVENGPIEGTDYIPMKLVTTDNIGDYFK